MLHEVAEPGPVLDGVVTRLWAIDMPRQCKVERILPMASVEIIVNLSDPYRLLGPREPAEGSPTPRVFCTGLRRELVHFENPERIRHICVQLPLFGATRFGLPPVLSVQAIGGGLGERLNALGEMLAGDDEVVLERALQLVRDVLEEHVLPESVAQETVRRATERLARDPAHPLGALAGDLGVSHKTLIGRFRQVLGVLPSDVARLLLLDRLLSQVPPTGESPTWAELAATGGFADQSHFIRTFKKFVCMTPGEYLASLRASGYGDQHFLGSES
ncbi:helix-turn-helix domain-containing protein [Tessaracoccus caeni]|uniref:helix-turn-helix domain-containing protein n=1 Tax=Tessaracoccus caeni TaxID=3031239 RepID=UPI0023DCC29D|nr:AraC family transcriptional regulator [Tessaracoccus caeni]MDF1488184.1 AraC family transcriptional regulator [Tessaracoccus caeni]